MLAFVQFAAPTLLLGVLAVAAPVLIHLLLRQKPRRVLFPPVRMLRKALASGQRAQRLHNLRLLLLRASVLAMAALLLAGPTCVPSSTTVGAAGPAAHVLIIDDSWSMSYQITPDQALLDAALSSADTFCRSVARQPETSRMALVWADPERAPAELSEDVATIRAALRDDSGHREHARPLGRALRAAAKILQSAEEPSGRLTVFTDLAAHAWRDVDAGLLSGIENLRVTVRSPTSEMRSNIAITTASGPRWIHPESSPVPLRATVSSDGLEASVTLVVREGGRVAERLGPIVVPASGARDVEFTLPPRAGGPHALTLDVEPTDRLAFDQRRFVAFQTGAKPVAWLITPAGDASVNDLTCVLLRNLLAPELLAPEQQRVELHELSPEEVVSDSGAESRGESEREVALIVVPGGVELNEAARQTIRHQAERGATVLLAPSSGEGGGDWPGLRRLLAKSMLAVETLPAVMTFNWTPESTFAHVSEGLDELTRVGVRRRVVAAGLEAGVAVEARYADDSPAILSIRLGRGRLVMLTTSPDPGWSDLGGRAAGLLTWLHVMLREAVGPPDLVANLVVGQEAGDVLPGLRERGATRVVNRTNESAARIAVSRDTAGAKAGGWPTDEPGIYAIEAASSGGDEALYTVNWPAAESDLAPIGAERLAQLLGVDHVDIVGAASTADAGGSLLFRLAGIRDAARLLPLALLALLLWELRLANRTRGQERQAPTASGRNQ